VSLPAERFLRGQGHRGAAQRVWRARSEEHMTARASTGVTTTTLEHAIPGRRLRRPEPCTMIIFGAGDLLYRKLMPSLFHLMGDGLLPDEFAVITVGREPMDDVAFRAQVRDALKTFRPDGAPFDERACDRFATQLHYVSGDLGDMATFEALRDRLAETDAKLPG